MSSSESSITSNSASKTKRRRNKGDGSNRLAKKQKKLTGEELLRAHATELGEALSELQEMESPLVKGKMRDIIEYLLSFCGKVQNPDFPRNKDELAVLQDTVSSLDDSSLSELSSTDRKIYKARVTAVNEWLKRVADLYKELLVRAQQGSPVAILSSSTARRNSTVKALYDRLNHYRFVLVRGTPASGKSTLAHLLEEYINNQEPEVNLIMTNSWPRGASWSTKLGTNFHPDRPIVIIIDEAQLSYWDDGFWNGFLKSIEPTSRHRAILFASYGSPKGNVSVEGTSMVVADRNRISLRPVDHADGIAPAGLFLKEDEFADMTGKLCPVDQFEEEFLGYVFRITAGHTGAVKDLFDVVLAHDSYRELKYTGGKYSLDIFLTQFPIAKLWASLESSSIFRRGLPKIEQLQKPAIARVFCAVLRNNHVGEDMLDSTEDREALVQCFKSGWLHATTTAPTENEKTLYIFTTELHQWFIEYYLGTRPISIPITDPDLTTFAFKVIHLFSPIELFSRRKMGASNKERPPEALFQDEFYRCCHGYSNGSLITFPEYGNARGRIDFCIPCKKWGVELLRDGDRLEEHSSRFTGSGAYADMNFQDYIILDFRTTPPRKKHPQMENLYHVVFKNAYKQVQILNGSTLDMIEEFSLLNPN